MVAPKYDRNVYGVTPPRESDEDIVRSPREINDSQSSPTSSYGPENIQDVATLLKARLNYAQIKIATGLSTEGLQQIERAFITSPRQPRRPLHSEYPSTPPHSSPHSRKLKRLLLSAMTPTQNSWRKKKRIREQKKNEAIQDEAAARTILMLSSAETPPILTPPRSGPSGSTNSPDDHRMRFYPAAAEYYGNDEPIPSLYDAISEIPDYDERSKRIADSLPRRKITTVVAAGSDDDEYPQHNVPPPPAIISDRNKSTGSPHQYYQYNRPLPPPPQYYRPRPPPMYGRPLAEDPFNSTPIIQNNVSTMRHSRSPLSPPH